MKPNIESRHSPARYKSYVVGFVLSVVTTLIAYFFVTNHVWPMQTMVYVVMTLAVVQLVVQAVFFLHIGRGSHMKLVTFTFSIIIVLIIVVGSIWIMNNLNYTMMHLTPSQQKLYMHQNEGI
jgi:cytochrome o ubiquinol oxidase operon protein cyoD